MANFNDEPLSPEPNPTKIAVAFGILVSALVASVLYLIVSAVVLQGYTSRQTVPVGPVRTLER